MDQITDLGSLLPATVELLRNRPHHMSLPKIARETGLTLGWLQTLAYNQSISNGFSVVKVERLYEYLSGKKLLTNAG